MSTTKACWCGCGGTTKSKFVPGHDARHHGNAKKWARAVHAGENPALPGFIHDEAEADFELWANRELAKLEAKDRANATTTTPENMQNDSTTPTTVAA